MLDKDFWDEYMRIYDAGLRGFFPYRKLLNDVACIVGEHRPHYLVDAGCGTGNLIRRLLSGTEPVGAIVGIEYNEAALERARKKFGKSRKVRLIRANLGLGGWVSIFEKKRPDCVVSVNVLYALQDPRVFLSSAHTVLKRGGILVVTNPYLAEPKRVLRAHERWLRERATPAQRKRDKQAQGARERLAMMNDRIAEELKGAGAHAWSVRKLAREICFHDFEILQARDDAYCGVNTLVVARRK